MAENPVVLSRVEGQVLQLTLNRPDVRNALDGALMRRVTELLAEHADDPAVRVVTFTGAGDAFCAGADLSWMSDALELSYEDTLRDSALLAELFYGIYHYPKPTVALINGATIGGGVGFAAACDVVLMADDAFFRLAEVHLGLTPAVISPFVLRKVGEGHCRDLMLTGRKVDAAEAVRLGLAHRAVPAEQLVELGAHYARYFRGAGPQALAACKELIARAGAGSADAVREQNVELIARLRTGVEGQEGMSAFLEKRKPSWRSTGG